MIVGSVSGPWSVVATPMHCDTRTGGGGGAGVVAAGGGELLKGGKAGCKFTLWDEESARRQGTRGWRRWAGEGGLGRPQRAGWPGTSQGRPGRGGAQKAATLRSVMVIASEKAARSGWGRTACGGRRDCKGGSGISQNRPGRCEACFLLAPFFFFSHHHFLLAPLFFIGFIIFFWRHHVFLAP